MGLNTVATIILVAVLGQPAQNQGGRLRTAVLDGNLAAVKSLGSSKALVNSASSEGITPLMMAAALGYTAIIEHLVTAGADVDASQDGITALMFAADGGQLEAVRVLLEKGANINAKDKAGNTALDYAEFNIIPDTKEGRSKAEAYLKEKGATVTRSPNERFIAMARRTIPATVVKNMKAKK